jgi:hypothetical protein
LGVPDEIIPETRLWAETDEIIPEKRLWAEPHEDYSRNTTLGGT